MIEVPAELQAERDALIAEIHEAFEGVTREGGVSWNETFVLDGYGSEEECSKARKTDRDHRWADLAYDETWIAGPGVGGWSFLDAIGFRYYLPAGMIRMLTAGHDAFPCGGLGRNEGRVARLALERRPTPLATMTMLKSWVGGTHILSIGSSSSRLSVRKAR
jgi:hypothetical protein